MLRVNRLIKLTEDAPTIVEDSLEVLLDSPKGSHCATQVGYVYKTIKHLHSNYLTMMNIDVREIICFQSACLSFSSAILKEASSGRQSELPLPINVKLNNESIKGAVKYYLAPQQISSIYLSLIRANRTKILNNRFFVIIILVYLPRQVIHFPCRGNGCWF